MFVADKSVLGLDFKKRCRHICLLQRCTNEISTIARDMGVLLAKYHHQFALPGQISIAHFDECVVVLAFT